MSNKSPRRRSREFALQAIYQWLIAAQSWSAIEKQYAEAESFDKADAALFKVIVVGVIAEAEVLSVALLPHLDRSFPEVSPIEKAIMLMAAYELSHMVETPYRVIINEAIELAKTFGGTDGHKYVNGVLDKYAAVVRDAEVAAPAPAPRKPAARTVTVTKKASKKLAE
jgi:transcription antitermination protein NusB